MDADRPGRYLYLGQVPGLREAADCLDGDMQPLSRLGASQQEIITGRHQGTPFVST